MAQINLNTGGDEHVIKLQDMIDVVQDAVNSVKLKIDAIKANNSSISIGDMFEMQMIMNNLSQLSEMSTNVVSSMHQAVSTMARNVKS